MPESPEWTPPEWTVSDRIRKAREVAGLEQRDLAEATGLDRNTISNAEGGVRRPSIGTLSLIAQALHVPVEWLRDGSMPGAAPS